MARKLKIFRTAIGFHDAYVAAPSQKAALEAWGSDRNLFAMGAAEAVEDGPLAEKARATPGKVIKVVRGTAEQHIAALPKARTKPAKTPSRQMAPKAPASKKLPRPSHAAVDRAEKTVQNVEQARTSDLDRIDREIAALTAKRRTARDRHDDKLAAAREELNSAQDDYDRRLAKWSNQG